MHEGLKNDLKDQLPDNWWVRNEVTCVVNDGEYLPDVGAWRKKPTNKQRTYPILYLCPPPSIWIEVNIKFDVIDSAS